MLPVADKELAVPGISDNFGACKALYTFVLGFVSLIFFFVVVQGYPIEFCILEVREPTKNCAPGYIYCCVWDAVFSLSYTHL